MKCRFMGTTQSTLVHLSWLIHKSARRLRRRWSGSHIEKVLEEGRCVTTLVRA